MVNQQNRQIQLVGKALDLSYFLVVACIRGIVSRLADDLKGVDDNKRKVGVFFFEVHQLRNQPVIQRIGFKGQKEISRALVGDGIQAVVDASVAVFQAEIENCARMDFQPPQRLSLGDMQGKVECHPRLADLWCPG